MKQDRKVIISNTQAHIGALVARRNVPGSELFFDHPLLLILSASVVNGILCPTSNVYSTYATHKQIEEAKPRDALYIVVCQENPTRRAQLQVAHRLHSGDRILQMLMLTNACRSDVRNLYIYVRYFTFRNCAFLREKRGLTAIAPHFSNPHR